MSLDLEQPIHPRAWRHVWRGEAWTRAAFHMVIYSFQRIANEPRLQSHWSTSSFLHFIKKTGMFYQLSIIKLSNADISSVIVHLRVAIVIEFD